MYDAVVPNDLSTVKIARGKLRDRPYHHGNLRPALVRAAIALVEAHGPESLSLRAVATEAGVSPTAPYSHFKDKRALLAAVAETGFERLRARMSPDPDAGATAEARFLMTGRGYVAFALEEPGLFRLMFSSVLGPLDAFPALQEKSDAAFALFRDCLDAVIDRGGLSRAERSTLRASAWALVHGLATLLVEQRLASGAEGAPDLIDAVTELYLRQIARPA